MTECLDGKSCVVPPPGRQNNKPTVDISYILINTQLCDKSGLSVTYQIATQTSLESSQRDVIEQLDLQVSVPLHEEGSRSQNLQS